MVFNSAGIWAVIDVDPDAEHHGVQPVEFRVHLRQDSADLLSVHQQIVRPADVHGKSGRGGYRLLRRHARHQRQHGSGGG